MSVERETVGGESGRIRWNDTERGKVRLNEDPRRSIVGNRGGLKQRYFTKNWRD